MLFCEKILYLHPILSKLMKLQPFFFPCSQGQGDWGYQNFCFSFKNVCHLVIHKGFTGSMKQKFRQLPRSLTQESIEACCRVEEWLASMFGFSVFIAQILQIVVCLCTHSASVTQAEGSIQTRTTDPKYIIIAISLFPSV